MTPLIVMLGVGFFLALLTLFLFLIAPASPQSAMLEEVTRQTRARSGKGSPEPLRSAAYLEWLAKPFSFLRGLFSHQPHPDIVRRLASAGYREPAHVDIFTGSRLAVPAVLGILVAFLIQESAIFFFLIAVVLGFFL